MVGGRLIEISHLSGTDPAIWRLWCINGADELAVKVRCPMNEPLPELGQEIWWQSGKVYFDNDTRHLEKVGNSFDPRDS